MSWHIVLNFLNTCGTSVDAQFIVGADYPAISAMTATQLYAASRGRGFEYVFWLALHLCLL